MMQKKKPDDYVIGTNSAYSVEEFMRFAFDYAGLEHKKYVKIDKSYYRPTEADSLIADSSKAKKALNWQPKVKLEDLAKIMVDADMRAAGLKPVGEGDKILKKKFPDRWWKAD